MNNHTTPNRDYHGWANLWILQAANISVFRGKPDEAMLRGLLSGNDALTRWRAIHDVHASLDLQSTANGRRAQRANDVQVVLSQRAQIIGRPVPIRRAKRIENALTALRQRARSALDARVVLDYALIELFELLDAPTRDEFRSEHTDRMTLQEARYQSIVSTDCAHWNKIRPPSPGERPMQVIT